MDTGDPSNGQLLVKYTFNAEEDGELSVSEGEHVTLMSASDGNSEVDATGMQSDSAKNKSSVVSSSQR